MKSNNTFFFKPLFYLFLFLAIGSGAGAQEKLNDLSTNPKLTQENKNTFQRNSLSWYPTNVYSITDTISLPFVDI